MSYFRNLSMMAFCLVGMSVSSVPVHALDLTGLASPQSIVYNEKKDEYFISNMNGIAKQKDGNGFIAKTDNNGLVVVLQFIASTVDAELHSPTGLGLFQGRLYVADIDRMIVYDANNGKHVKTISFVSHGAKFLSDIAIGGDGKIFLTDIEANMIFMLDATQDDKVIILSSSENLDGPKSLLIEPSKNGVMIVSSNHGRILRVTLDGKIDIFKDIGKSLGGIVVDRQGDLYVSSIAQGEIYKIDQSRGSVISLFRSNLTTPGDMAYNPVSHEIIVPLTADNKVTAISVK